jgi:2-dehydro-3-deoxyphosphogluconate aldolase / (4S)-4-hydroxy-2-oxoglutarate aldolase
MTIDDIMQLAPVIPVLVLDGEVDAARLAETLVEAGLPVIEVTLRTPSALDAIKSMSAVPGAVVGAGTVLTGDQFMRAEQAGSRFIVSPGLTDQLAGAAVNAPLPFLPGISTASEIMRGLELGFDRFKFFPAEASGGVEALKALTGPFPEVRFCPTGGIKPDTAAAWLALGAVSCVGGSWIYRSGDDLRAVAERARAARALAAG